MKNIITNVLEEMGIPIEVGGEDEDVDLREYILDSLQFVEFVVMIEEKLGTELTDEILVYDNLSSLNGFCLLIDSSSINLSSN
jgi:acyl carrier protein